MEVNSRESSKWALLHPAPPTPHQSNTDSSFIFFQGISNDPSFTSSTVLLTPSIFLFLLPVLTFSTKQRECWVFPWNRPDQQVTAMTCSVAFIIWDPKDHTVLSEQRDYCIKQPQGMKDFWGAVRLTFTSCVILCCTLNPLFCTFKWFFLFPQVRANSIHVQLSTAWTTKAFRAWIIILSFCPIHKPSGVTETCRPDERCCNTHSEFINLTLEWYRSKGHLSKMERRDFNVI